MKTALVSVSDTTDLDSLVSFLCQNNVEVYATESTKKFLWENGLYQVKDAVDLTNFKPILNGRVKTLHPNIHGGILAENIEDLIPLGITPIDIVVCNFYKLPQENVLENTDIGGPTLVRSSCKNSNRVCVLTNPEDYPVFIEEYKTGEISKNSLRNFAVKALGYVTEYDINIYNSVSNTDSRIFSSYSLESPLRYGENPHQQGKIYKSLQNNSRKLEIVYAGKEVSYNNYLDIESAIQTVSEFEGCCAIIKHNNACGIAVNSNLFTAFLDAYASDTVSAFGGVVAVSENVDMEFVTRYLGTKLFTEVFIAPSFSEYAVLHLQKKKPNLIIVKYNKEGYKEKRKHYIQISDYLLVQGEDTVSETEFKLVSGNFIPDIKDLTFAWKAAKTVKSNAIVLTQGTRTVGIGAGQMSRVDSVKIALEKAGVLSQDSILASDAFFPFSDGIELAARNGVSVVIQPGGSKKDEEVIAKAQELGLTMYLTGYRHFRHV